MSTAEFYVGDTRKITASLPADSVDLVLTSPPFLALRSYLPADHPDKDLEVGQEPDPAAFIDVLLELTAEWERVLTPHGSIAVELGDTYSGSGGAGGDYNEGGLREGQQRFGGSGKHSRAHMVATGLKPPQSRPGPGQRDSIEGWPLAKSLCLIPELYRVALAYGINPITGAESPAGRWRVRNTVTWCRPNPPVGALADKYRPATSDMVIATKARDRWFDLDAVRSPHTEPDRVHRRTERDLVPEKLHHPQSSDVKMQNPEGAPPLDWWEISTHPYKGSHYATWPPQLCEIPIKSMCPPNGIVLDPFAGSGTTLAVATGHGRRAIGIDLDERNADLARERVGMFLTVHDRNETS